MGGLGSGRTWHSGAKDCTDDYRSIDVRRWKRDGLLIPNLSFGWQWIRNDTTVASIWVRTEPNQVFLEYRHRRGRKEWKDESYPILIDWTDCNLGGQRPWFRCPAYGCGRRVAILYGSGIFACRHCLELAYPSQRESRLDRATRQANRIRDKLGWEPGVLNGKGFKPKGMHWSTFDRLTKKHDAFTQLSFSGLTTRLNMIRKSIN